MQKSLKNYKAEQSKNGANNANGTENAKQTATELLNKYGNMSEDALFSALMEEVASSKSNGTFDINALSVSLDKMRPFLTPAQNDKLNHLIGLIGS